MESLQIKGVSKTYGKNPALNNIHLNIQRGMFGLLGPNGAGKTTLMRILTTIIPANKGEITFGRYSIKQENEFKSIVGYLPQSFSIYKQIKVDEALQHIAVLKGLKHNIRQKVNEVLEQVNLLEHQHKKIAQLSGGMIRRVGIAQALLGEPQILIVDEPTSGLDPEERIRFRKILRQVGNQSIVIISTHIVEDIETTCDQAAIMFNGNVLIQGNIRDISQAAAGKVWETTVTPEQFHNIPYDWNVISSYREEDSYRVKTLSEIQPENGKMLSPSLEDGYLYLMKREKS
ncbi:ABC transporter ATP-binding protein [Cohnella soli]|uniref:ABC transporter ATP-binding protein n=1 Tax=Cohnella soli TaxID=425005 RepID=A0ABW0HQW5_9BACL